MPYDSSQGSLKTLRKEYAERARRTVFFVGSGPSVEVGVPSWTQLKTEVFEAICELVTPISPKADIERFQDLQDLYLGKDFWRFFDAASSGWPTAYRDSLSSILNEDIEKLETPVVYKKLWSMSGVNQVLSLNIDGLLSKAFSEIHSKSSSRLFDYDGFNCSDAQQYFMSNKSCLVNLHGTYHSPLRWIMSESERRALRSGGVGERYAAFLTWVFQTFNVVFVGISPDDEAVSFALEIAASTGLLGRHFWICPESVITKQNWAEQKGIRMILYKPFYRENGTPVHSQEICAILDDIEKFVSHDTPVMLPQVSEGIDPSSVGGSVGIMNLFQSDRGKAIENLASVATFVGNKSRFDSSIFNSFVREYNLQLQLASSIDPNVPGYDKIGEYKTSTKISSRGSSSVWIVRDEKANRDYAVKILHAQSHEDPIERVSFRRGIESLYLLKSQNFPVAPKYVSHGEFPLFVCMELLQGASIKELRTDPEFDMKRLTLPLFLNIAECVMYCHSSDGVVLHRDLKPSNIIVENWFTGYDIFDVIQQKVRLINFDMSWHKFSSGNTKAITAEDYGYYSPEQRRASNTEPPRTAATDVYMLGMILYYLMTAVHPSSGGSDLADWDDQVNRAVRQKFQNKLIENRLARLIKSMTSDVLKKRPDLSSVIAEVRNLILVLKNELDHVDDEIILEKFIVGSERNYEWCDQKIEATIASLREAQLVFRLEPRGRRIKMSFSRSRDEAARRKTFGEKINARIDEVRQVLRDSCWEVQKSGGVISVLEAEIRVSEIKDKKDFGENVVKIVCQRLLSAIE